MKLQRYNGTTRRRCRAVGQRCGTRNEGFTLIEMMISVAIGALLLGGGIAAYNNFDRKQKVQSAGRELVLALSSAQKRADSGERPVGCGSLEAWAVRRVNVLSYETAVVCDGGVYTVVATKNLPSSVEVTTGFDLRFLVLTGGVGGPGTIDLEDLDGTTLYQVEVTAAGAVDDKGFQ